LGNDAFQNPAWLLVELADLFPGLSLGRVLLAELGLEDLAEESDPRGHLAWVKEVWRDFNLHKMISTR